MLKTVVSKSRGKNYKKRKQNPEWRGLFIEILRGARALSSSHPDEVRLAAANAALLELSFKYNEEYQDHLMKELDSHGLFKAIHAGSEQMQLLCELCSGSFRYDEAVFPLALSYCMYLSLLLHMQSLENINQIINIEESLRCSFLIMTERSEELELYTKAGQGWLTCCRNVTILTNTIVYKREPAILGILDSSNRMISHLMYKNHICGGEHFCANLDSRYPDIFIEYCTVSSFLVGHVQFLLNTALSGERIDADYLFSLKQFGAVYKTMERLVQDLHDDVSATKLQLIVLERMVSCTVPFILTLFISGNDKVRGSIEEIIFPLLPSLFQSSFRCIVRHTQIGPTAGECESLEAVAHFLKEMCTLSVNVKPRPSWMHYSNMLSSIIFCLIQIPPVIARGPMARPNYPKEAIDPTLSEDTGLGALRLTIVKALRNLLIGSNRGELSTVLNVSLQQIKASELLSPPLKLAFAETVLHLIEDPGSTAAVDLIDHQSPDITLALIQALEIIRSDLSSNYSENMLHSCNLRHLFKEIQEALQRDQDQCPLEQTAITVFEKDGELPKKEIHVIHSSILCLATIMRILESLFSRPGRFKKVPKRYKLMALNEIPSMVALLAQHPESPPEHLNIAILNICHLITGMIRHSTDCLGRGMHVLNRAIASIQKFLAYIFVVSPETAQDHWLETLSRILEAYSSVKVCTIG